MDDYQIPTGVDVEDGNNEPAQQEDPPRDGGVLPTLREIKRGAIKLLYEGMPPSVDRALNTIEKKTSLKRQQIAVAAFAVLLTLLVIHPHAHLLCDSIGFVYPAYRSIEVLRNATAQEMGPEWICYWMIFAAYHLLDVLFGKMPGKWGTMTLHWVVKTMVLAYCFLPQTRGALKLYLKLVRPMVRAG